MDHGRDRIIKGISFGLELEEAWPLIRELIETFSPYMERGGHWESWNWVLTQAIEVAQRSKDRDEIVILSTLLARLLQRQSHFRQAITRYRHTIHIARQIPDRYNEARACSNLGYLYIEKGNLYRAEILCCRALAIFEHLNNNHGQAHTENHLGILYTRQGFWEQARQHLERACALWQVMADNHGLMRGFINLGMLYNDMGHPDRAIPYLERALQQAQRSGEQTEIGTIYLNIGAAHQLMGASAQAEASLWKAETIFRRVSNPIGLAGTWHNLGLACTSQGKRTEAHSHLKAALEAGRSLQGRHFEANVLSDLVEYELARDNPPQAAEWLNELERFINKHKQLGRFGQLQSLVKKHRCSLTERLARQAADD